MKPVAKTQVRRLLKEGALRNAKRDLKLAEEWCGLDEVPCRETSE